MPLEGVYKILKDYKMDGQTNTIMADINRKKDAIHVVVKKDIQDAELDKIRPQDITDDLLG